MIETNALILVGLILGFILVCLTRWALATRALKLDAQDEYKSRQANKPGTVANVSEAVFERVYLASFQPRWFLYAAGGAAAALAVSPISLLLVPWAYDAVWRLGGAPEWGGRGGYVYMFILAFSLALIWALVAAIFARLFYLNAPEPFMHALARARGEPLPEDTGYRRRPKWARRVRPNATSNSSSDADAGEARDKE